MRTVNICWHFLCFPTQVGALQSTFNWCQAFLSFTGAAPITPSAASWHILFYLAVSPWGLCISHVWSIVESSKQLFGSDTLSKGEVIPKAFSSQKNSMVISSSEEINRVAFFCHLFFLAIICNHFFCLKETMFLFLVEMPTTFLWKLMKSEIKSEVDVPCRFFLFFSNRKSSKEMSHFAICL